MAYLSQVKLGNSTYDISAVKLKNARTIQTNLASVSSASFDGTANITPGVTGILAIANGGTNANSAKQARVNLLSIGSNPITTVEDDTTVNWGSYGPCATAFYTTTGQLTDQPSQWGFVHNIMTSTSSEVHQLWTTQAGGDIYHRGGNASGWATSWKKLLDSSNFNSYAPTLTGTGATGTWGINISGSSASCTGNAATATKLTSSAGGVTTPIYFSSGKPAACTMATSGNWWGALSYIGTDGVMEIGKYIDFHNSDTSTKDFSTRITCNGDTQNELTLPTKSGTIALTSDLSSYLPLSGGTITGAIKKASTSQSWVNGRSGAAFAHLYDSANRFTGNQYNPLWSAKSINGSWDCGTYTANNSLYFTYITDTNFDAGTNTTTAQVEFRGSDGSVRATKVYGAVWNDYAEYRSQQEEIKPGYCVASSNNGKVYKTTEMYQACDGIVSDTFGFAIGEIDDYKTPLAVAGRVLTYCAGNKYDYQVGDTVCAGPGGLAYKMSREEIKEYPDRIIGIVSEIPEYEIWGTGKVKVNNRIWIKVK